MAPLDVSLSSSAPLRLGLGLWLSFWAVDNPHTRKSCLLGPAHCSSPPPSPLPPPSSLLRLPASWPGARPATAAAAAAAYSCCCSCCCCYCRSGPKLASLTLHLPGSRQLFLGGRGMRAEKKRRSLREARDSLTCRLLLPLGCRLSKRVSRNVPDMFWVPDCP